MKKLFLTVLLGVLLTGAAVGQTIPGSWSGGVGQINQVKIIPLYCPTEGDYVPNQLGTVNDTSSVVYLPQFDEAWILTKVIPGTAHDSVFVNLLVEGKFINELVTGYTSRGNGWFQLDSSTVTIADTLGGDLKKVAIPPGIEQIRIIWDGITDNDGLTQGTSESSWLILKY